MSFVFRVFLSPQQSSLNLLTVFLKHFFQIMRLDSSSKVVLVFSDLKFFNYDITSHLDPSTCGIRKGGNITNFYKVVLPQTCFDRLYRKCLLRLLQKACKRFASRYSKQYNRYSNPIIS